MNNRGKIHLIAEDELRKLIASCKTYSECLRKIGLSTSGSGSRTSLKNRIEELSIDISHFDKYHYDAKPHKDAKPLSYYLVEKSTITQCNLKRRLIKEKMIPYKCDVCGNKGEWAGKPLSLQLDHINGNHCDNRLSNLRFLCPNCHSQTDTYAGKINKSLKKEAYKKENPENKKECSCCHKIYTPKDKRQKYCSQTCAAMANRKVARPSTEQLKEDILYYKNNMSAIGRKYGVSDNAIRKWIRKML